MIITESQQLVQRYKHWLNAGHDIIKRLPSYKIVDNLQLGDRVSVHWDVENVELIDEGYIFSIPECYDSTDHEVWYAMTVHIDKPHVEPKGDREEVWMNINDLILLDDVISIRKVL